MQDRIQTEQCVFYRILNTSLSDVLRMLLGKPANGQVFLTATKFGQGFFQLGFFFSALLFLFAEAFVAQFLFFVGAVWSLPAKRAKPSDSRDVALLHVETIEVEGSIALVARQQCSPILTEAAVSLVLSGSGLAPQRQAPGVPELACRLPPVRIRLGKLLSRVFAMAFAFHSLKRAGNINGRGESVCAGRVHEGKYGEGLHYSGGC